MKMWLMVFLAAVIGVATHASAEEREPPHTQLALHLRVFEGERFGNPDERKMLGEATLVTLENRACSWNSGTNVPVPGSMPQRFVECGRRIEMIPLELNDDKVQLDIALSNTTQVASLDDRTRFHTSHLHTIAKVGLGEVDYFDWEQLPGEKPTWIEFAIDVVKP